MYDPGELYQAPMMKNMSVGYGKQDKPKPPKMPPHPTDTKLGMKHPNAHK